jgi:uncharacterized protein (TIGR00251 family)
VARIAVRLQPRASSNEVTGEHDDAIAIRVTAPPVDGKANAALIGFVAKRLKVAKSRIAITRGETGRDKLLEIEGLTESEVRAKLLRPD